MKKNQIIEHNIKHKSLLSILVLIFIFILIISIIGTLYFSWFWILILPLSFFIVALYQTMSEHFWTSKKYCPRCHAPVGIYSEFCRNCGLQLLFKCPSCGKFYQSEVEICEKCNFKFQKSERIIEQIDYNIIKKGTNLPERANFCPHCGTNLRNIDYQIVCPFCGNKID